MEIFKNFKRYTNKDERLALLAKEVDGELEVFILKCSKSDFFKKILAKIVYTWYLEGEPLLDDYHPQIVKVAIEEGNTAKYTFKSFCDLYYTKHTSCLHRGMFKNSSITYDYLKCGYELITLKNTLKWM